MPYIFGRLCLLQRDRVAQEFAPTLPLELKSSLRNADLPSGSELFPSDKVREAVDKKQSADQNALIVKSLTSTTAARPKWQKGKGRASSTPAAAATKASAPAVASESDQQQASGSASTAAPRSKSKKSKKKSTPFRGGGGQAKGQSAETAKPKQTGT